MDATSFHWTSIDEDHPIRFLTRRVIKGEKMMVAEVRLAKGCHVATHQHESEQIAIVVSGEVLWKLGEPGSESCKESILYGGDVMVVPSNVVHSVDAIEDTLIYDVLSPIGPMGVDSQKA